MNFKTWKWALPLILLANACKKDDVTPVTPTITTTGVYVLSEGTFNGNDTRLGYYDFGTSTMTGDVYKSANGTDLGDTGNDMIIYGTKIYIVMNKTSNVTVVDATTTKKLKTIAFKNGTVNKEPRYAIAKNGKVYVSSYDGTVSVIDTTTLAITKTIAVGSNPEGVAIAGNYLYVANSGGLNLGVYDSTVSVIDLSTDSEIKKIKVGINSVNVAASSTGDIYVTNYGDFGSVTPRIFVIDGQTNTLKTKLDASLQFTHIRISGDVAYLYNNYGGVPGGCKLLDTKTNTVLRDKFITDGTVLTATYGINFDDTNGDVYLTDAKNFSTSGDVYCFDKNGKKKFSFSASPGINPNTVAFLRK